MDLIRRSPWNAQLLLFLMAASTSAQLQDNATFARHSSGEVLRNMIVVGPYVVVGSSAAIYVLNNSSLAQVGAVNLASPNLLLVANYTSNEVLFCGNSNCTLSPVGALTSPSWSYAWSTSTASVINTATAYNVAGSLTTDSQGNKILVLGEREVLQTGTLVPSKVTLGSIMQAPVSAYSAVAYQAETKSPSGREFLTSFSYNNYVYFVFQLATASPTNTRVARVCANDTGNVFGGDNLKRLSYYEIPLTCLPPGLSSSAVSTPTAASFFPSSSAFNYDPTIVVSSVMAGNSYLCAYSLTTIDNLINQKYSTCVNGNGYIGFLRNQDTPQCVFLTPAAFASSVSRVG